MPLNDRPRPLPDNPQPDAERRSTRSLLDRKTQRTLAKTGVLVALGVLVWSGMQRPRRRYMPLHTWTGVALIGLTLWHWSLYLPRPERHAQARRSGSRGGPPAPAAKG
jgi:hypothetical protein